MKSAIFRFPTLIFLFAAIISLTSSALPQTGAVPFDAATETGRLLSSADRAPVRKIGFSIENVPAAENAVLRTAVADLEKLAFELINQKRAEAGLAPLVWDETVAGVARLHSENMAKNKFLSHTGPDGESLFDRAERLGPLQAVGENIAFNRGFRDPVENAVENWLRSNLHRDNLLSDFWHQSGIGIAVSADGAYYFTQVFVSR